MSLHRQLNMEATELRGIGIQLSRLESCSNKVGGNGIAKFLRPKSEICREEEKNDKSAVLMGRENKLKIEHKTSSSSAINNFFLEKKLKPDQSKTKSSSSKTVDPAEIDESVLEALPEDIRKEVMEEYGLRRQNNSSKEKPLSYDNCLNYSQVFD